MKSKNINVIDIIVSDKEDLYNNFNSKKLSSELGSYIYNQSLGYSIKDDIKINIKIEDELTKNEKNDIVDMIREYFGLSIRETLIYYKYNNFKKIVLFILGIILIYISHFVGTINDFLISEVFLIIGWVAIWEVFENILLVESKKKFKLKRLKRLVKCKISFGE
ncbi:MAG: hypothetical protein HFI87_07105 [Bacilli bacterium]|nr:hypothetical protein [Bacilli bacterium]